MARSGARSTTTSTIGRWLTPLFLGTFAGAFAAAAVHALTDPRLPWLPYVGVVKWVIYLLAFALLGWIWVVATALYDVLLLKLRVRVLPTGLRAFALSVAGPLLGGLALKLWPAFSSDALLPWLASTLAPTLVFSAAFRLALGKRP